MSWSLGLVEIFLPPAPDAEARAATQDLAHCHCLEHHLVYFLGFVGQWIFGRESLLARPLVGKNLELRREERGRIVG